MVVALESRLDFVEPLGEVEDEADDSPEVVPGTNISSKPGSRSPLGLPRSSAA